MKIVPSLKLRVVCFESHLNYFLQKFNSVDKSLTWFMYSVYFTEMTG